MAGTRISKQGETVDLVCFSWYGRTRDVTEAVLSANPGLAARGAILPPGTKITMPDITSPTAGRSLIDLWT